MNTEYIENLSAFKVCMWVDEHPDTKIISICSSNRGINLYTIFYQRNES